MMTKKIQSKQAKLKELILAILTKTPNIPKVKLAKLILFAELEHFKRTGESFTGLYFVRLPMGPVIAFYDQVLEDGIGKYWNQTSEPIHILEEGTEKIQYHYTALEKPIADKGLQTTIDKVIHHYSHKSGKELSLLSHDLPAWRYAEPLEPIYLAELAAVDEKEYFALTDLVEDIEDADDLAKKIPRPLCPA